MAFVLHSERNSALDDGVWADFGGSRFLIASTSNSKFMRAMNRLQAPFRKQIEKGTMDPDDTKNIVVKSLAEAILKGWEDVKDPTGKDVPFSKEMAIIALANNEELREFVQEFATDLANFREQDIEEKGKP